MAIGTRNAEDALIRPRRLPLFSSAPEKMKLAILLYGIFRNEDAHWFWKTMLPPGDLFVFSTFTANPRTTRSRDLAIHGNYTFGGISVAKHWSIVDQDLYDRTIQLDASVETSRDPFRNSVNKTSLKNAVRVLHQLDSLRQLFLEHDHGYTHLLLSRVDVLFTRRVDARLFEEGVVIPDYAHFLGLNDRFAAGPKNDILRLMDRLPTWRRTRMVAERLLKAVVTSAGIRVRAKHVGYTRRIRGGGVLNRAQYRVQKNCSLDTATSMAQLKPFDALGSCH